MEIDYQIAHSFLCMKSLINLTPWRIAKENYNCEIHSKKSFVDYYGQGSESLLHLVRVAPL